MDTAKLDGLKMDTMTANQIRFCEDAIREGVEIHAYSGRGMYGVECPSVHVGQICDATFTRASFDADTLGMGYVLYARG